MQAQESERALKFGKKVDSASFFLLAWEGGVCSYKRTGAGLSTACSSSN